MAPIEENILRYPQLPPDERKAVEAYVDDHPELAPLLEEAKTWNAAFGEAGRPARGAPADEALAYLVATRYAEHHAPPPALERVLARLEARVAADPERRARYEHLTRRLRELDRAGDPAAQLEALTGHRLHPAPRADRPPRPRRRLRRFAVVGAAVVGGALIVYAALFGLSRATEPDRYRLAALERGGVAAELRQIRLRGGLAEGEVYEPLREAVVHLHEARETTLGLFPRYDARRLERAAAALEAIEARAGTPPALRQEAAFLLGKVRLAQGDVAAARRLFDAVARSGDGPAEEAARVLEQIPDGEIDPSTNP